MQSYNLGGIQTCLWLLGLVVGANKFSPRSGMFSRWATATRISYYFMDGHTIPESTAREEAPPGSLDAEALG
jgi:hypothetical protein